MKNLTLLIFLTIAIPSYGQVTSQTLQKIEEDSVATFPFQYKSYPNPFSHSTILSFSNPDQKYYHLYLIDVDGKVMRSYGDIREEKVEIFRDGLKPGVYLFELRGEVSYFGRLVLE